MTAPPDPPPDHEALFTAEIKPLLTQIAEICEAAGLAFVAGFELRTDPVANRATLFLASFGHPGSCPNIALAARVLGGEVTILDAVPTAPLQA
jgi:hypothetical protein